MTIAECKNCGVGIYNLTIDLCLRCAVETFPIKGSEVLKMWQHFGYDHNRAYGPLPAKLIRHRCRGTWHLLFADGHMIDTYHAAYGRGMYYKRWMDKIVHQQKS